MKSTLIYSAFSLMGILLFFGCEKNTLQEDLLVPEANTAMQLITVNDQGEVLETVSVDPRKDIPTPYVKGKGNPNQIATGDYETTSGNKYLFSAIKNKGGVHGEWEITASFGHYILETICVSTNEENGTATIAGIVTEVLSGRYLENDIFFFRAKDNGEGAKSSPDQTSNAFGIYRNWLLVFDDVDDFLANINCANPPNNLVTVMGPFGDRIGQIQVK